MQGSKPRASPHPCGFLLHGQVRYATNSAFTGSSMVPYYMTNLGGVMCVTLNNLTPGQVYYVGVAACNSLGCGLVQNTLPPFEHPRKAPGGPATVQLGVTSSTKVSGPFVPACSPE